MCNITFLQTSKIISVDFFPCIWNLVHRVVHVVEKLLSCFWKIISLFYTYLNISWWFAKFWCMNNSTISSTNLWYLLILYQRKRVWIVTYSTTIYQMAFFIPFNIELKNINEFVQTTYVTLFTRYILTDHQYLVKVSLMVHTIKHLFVYFLGNLNEKYFDRILQLMHNSFFYLAWYRGLKLCYCN